jgi:hypothetical protein|tara:strand:- start:341 stop:655 length:315 start_codon:yes stop_codon:yes gene_type:complete
MFLWILQQTIISIILIVSLHYIYLFFKDNLTIPKTKDLVKKPTEQYNKIYDVIKKKNNEKNNMKNELKNYIKELSKKNENKQPPPKVNTPESVGNFSGSNFSTF